MVTEYSEDWEASHTRVKGLHLGRLVHDEVDVHGREVGSCVEILEEVGDPKLLVNAGSTSNSFILDMHPDTAAGVTLLSEKLIKYMKKAEDNVESYPKANIDDENNVLAEDGAPNIIIRTYNRPLVGIRRKPLYEFENKRLLRFLDLFITYNISCKYHVVDALSWLLMKRKVK